MGWMKARWYRQKRRLLVCSIEHMRHVGVFWCDWTPHFAEFWRRWGELFWSGNGRGRIILGRDQHERGISAWTWLDTTVLSWSPTDHDLLGSTNENDASAIEDQHGSTHLHFLPPHRTPDNCSQLHWIPSLAQSRPKSHPPRTYVNFRVPWLSRWRGFELRHPGTPLSVDWVKATCRLQTIYKAEDARKRKRDSVSKRRRLLPNWFLPGQSPQSTPAGIRKDLRSIPGTSNVSFSTEDRPAINHCLAVPRLCLDCYDCR